MLRNKLIHCEPDAVAKIIQELVLEFTHPSVVKHFSLTPGSTGADILEVLATQKGAVDVRTTVSRSEGFIGWMMQAAGDGTFDKAVAILGRGIAVLDSKAAT